MIERITSARAQGLDKGDIVVSPFTAPAFAPLRISAVIRSPTGERMFVKIARVAGVSQRPDGWALATNFWFPPQGFTFDRSRWCWERSGALWKRPTLSELGLERGDDGFRVEAPDGSGE
jgi:hypothetical protein